MVFTCRKCGRKHEREGDPVDEYITCSCGYCFYVFDHLGMSVIIPASDFGTKLAKNAFRLLVISTGRCQDATADVLDCSGLLKKIDSAQLIQMGLNKWQEGRRKKCPITAGNILSICKTLMKNLDAVVKLKKDEVVVYEDQRKAVSGTDEEIEEEPRLLFGEPPDLKDWQREIMERNQAKTKGPCRKSG